MLDFPVHMSRYPAGQPCPLRRSRSRGERGRLAKSLQCRMRQPLSQVDLNLSSWESRSTYFIAFGKPAGHRDVASREFDVHSRWKPARDQKRKEEEEAAEEEEERKTKTEP